MYYKGLQDSNPSDSYLHFQTLLCSPARRITAIIHRFDVDLGRIHQQPDYDFMPLSCRP
jgi:hypothetical protein